MTNRRKDPLTTFLLGVVVALTTAGCLGNGRGITPIRTAFNKGVYLQGQGNLEAARDMYLEALDEDVSDTRARFNLALVHESLAARATDDETRRRALSAADEAYETILRADPNHLRATVNRAARLADEGDPEAARQVLAQARAAHPGAALPIVATASLYLRFGEALGVAEPVDRVLDLLEAAKRAQPKDPTTNWMLARVLIRREGPGDFDRARALLEDALERDPIDLGALRAMATLELAAERPRAAQTAAERLLFADPDHRAGHLIAGQAAEAQGDLERAAFHLHTARQLPPRSGDPRLDITAALRRIYTGLLDGLDDQPE